MRCAKTSFGWVLLSIALIAAVAVLPDAARASIVFSGDYSPTDSGDSGANWNLQTDGIIGNTGIGSLTITSGGIDDLYSGTAYIGHDYDGDGTADISGSGSTWTNGGDFYVGYNYNSFGVLNVHDHGVVANNTGYIAHEEGSWGAATIDNATWTNSGNLLVGNNGNGNLYIYNGGSVVCRDGSIAYGGLSESQVTVDGAGSTWTCTGTTLRIGSGSSGILTISNGGSVVATNAATQIRETGDAYIQFNNGSLATKSFYSGSSNSYLKGAGTVTTQGLVSDVNLTFDSAGSLNQTLSFTGTGQNVTVQLNQSSAVELGAGYAGNGTILINNGMAVTSKKGYFGYKDGSSGTMTVSGAGAQWTNSSYLYLGHDGQGTLLITNGADATGGTVTNYTAYLGYNETGSGAATVTGSGSKWKSSTLYVGYKGSNNNVSVLNGAQLESSSAYIGNNSTASGTVTVDGAGSTWSNTSTSLYVGKDGTGMLKIQGGGEVAAPNSTTYVASGDGSVGKIKFGTGGGTLSVKTLYANAADVTGTGTINARGLVTDANMTLHSDVSTFTLNDNVSATLTMNSTSGAGDFGAGYWANGTAEIGNGATIISYKGYVGYNSGSEGAVTVTGADAKWSNSNNLYVGYNGDGVLEITNGSDATGGTVSNRSGYIANGSGSAGTVTVNGPGSMWSNTSTYLYVGNEGVGQLNIQNGGVVAANNAATYVGYAAGPSAVNFSTGTLSTKSLYAATNQLTGTGTVETKGLVSDVDLTFDSASSLTQTLTDFGSVDVTLTMNGGDLGVGNGSGGGTLQIENGVTVNSGTGYIGYRAGSSGAATVTGPDTKWANSSNLYVGNDGTGSLTIQSGGSVTNASGSIGESTGSSGTVTVTGADSYWKTNYTLNVGNNGTGALYIQDQAYVEARTTNIANRYNETGASSVVVEDGSQWAHTYDIYVGVGGTGTLMVRNGSTVSSRKGYISGSSAGMGSGGWGEVTIDGDGAASYWNMTGELYVGYSNAGALNITNGAAVTTTSTTYVGYLEDTATGAIHLDDGSLQTKSLYASPSQLTGAGTVTTGGLVSDIDLAFNSTLGTTQTLTGAGSFGNVVVQLNGDSTADLGAGWWGAGSLNISEGVAITSANGYLGYHTSGSGTATVNGSDSKWTVSSALYVGYSGTAELNIENGGTVAANVVTAAYRDGSSATVNFDGGILQAGGSTNGWIATSIYPSCFYIKEGGATFDTAGYTKTISAVLEHGGSNPTDGGLTKQGAGKLTLSAANTYTGATVVTAGTLAFGTDDAIATGTVNINGGTLDIAGYSDSVGAVTLEDGVINGTTGVLTSTSGFAVQKGSVSANLAGNVGLTKTTSETVVLSGANTYTGQTIVEGGILELDPDAQAVILSGGTGAADLKAGKMVFNYSSTAPDIGTLLAESFGAGDASAWTTGQFLSTTADATHGLGWVDDGVSQVTVMYTLYGDSNLDGSVNGTDLNAVLSYYNQSSQVWACGDFNYDGSVNGTDLNTVLSNYNQSLSSSTAAVPEPSTLVLALAGLASLLVYVIRKRK